MHWVMVCKPKLPKNDPHKHTQMPLSTRAAHCRIPSSRTFQTAPLTASARWQIAWLQMLLSRRMEMAKAKWKRHQKLNSLTLTWCSRHLQGKIVQRMRYIYIYKDPCDCIFSEFVFGLMKSLLQKPDQTKKKLRKFLDSMIQKGGKIRALVREIQEEYSNSTILQQCHPQSQFHRIDSNSVYAQWSWVIITHFHMMLWWREILTYICSFNPGCQSLEVQAAVGSWAQETGCPAQPLQHGDGQGRGWRLQARADDWDTQSDTMWCHFN